MWEATGAICTSAGFLAGAGPTENSRGVKKSEKNDDAKSEDTRNNWERKYTHTHTHTHTVCA